VAEMLIFMEGGKLENPKKKTSKQERETLHDVTLNCFFSSLFYHRKAVEKPGP
jgi:hypothetical protein